MKIITRSIVLQDKRVITFLLIIGLFICHYTFLFAGAYNQLQKQFGFIFPLGWDPPVYVGYAKMILQGELRRPVLDGNNVRLPFYLIAIISASTGLVPEISTIVFIHLTLFCYVLFSVILLQKSGLISGEHWKAFTSGLLILFSPSVLRAYTIPAQAFSMLLLVCSILSLLRWYDEKFKMNSIGLIMFICCNILLFYTHWYYDLLIMTLFIVITFIIVSIQKSDFRNLIKILLAFSFVYLATVPLTGLSFEKIFHEWPIGSRINSPYVRSPDIITAVNLINDMIFGHSYASLALYLLGIVYLFRLQETDLSTRKIAIILFRVMTVSFFSLSLFSILFLKNKSYAERLLFDTMQVFILPMGLEFLVKANKRTRINLILYTENMRLAIKPLQIIGFMLLIFQFATNAQYLTQYRQTILIPYIEPDTLAEIREARDAYVQGNYDVPPIVVIYRPDPSIYRTFAIQKYTLMVFGSAYTYYGKACDMVELRPTLEGVIEYEKGLSMYYTYILRKYIDTVTLQYHPFIFIGSLNNQYGDLLIRNKLNNLLLNSTNHLDEDNDLVKWNLEELPKSEISNIGQLMLDEKNKIIGNTSIRVNLIKDSGYVRFSVLGWLTQPMNYVNDTHLVFQLFDNNLQGEWQIRISTNRWVDFFYYTFEEDFVGWKLFFIPLINFHTRGNATWTHITSIEFLRTASKGTWYFDRVLLYTPPKYMILDAASLTALAQKMP